MSLLLGRLNHLSLTLAFGTAMERHLIQKVALDPNSTIVSTVGKIWHNRADFFICVSVSMKEGSRCPHQSLVGRISGKSPVVLKWEPLADQDQEVRLSPNTTTYCGLYDEEWLLPGVFFGNNNHSL